MLSGQKTLKEKKKYVFYSKKVVLSYFTPRTQNLSTVNSNFSSLQKRFLFSPLEKSVSLSSTFENVLRSLPLNSFSFPPLPPYAFSLSFRQEVSFVKALSSKSVLGSSAQFDSSKTKKILRFVPNCFTPVQVPFQKKFRHRWGDDCLLLFLP